MAVFAASVVLGEGAAYLGLVLAIAALVVRRRALRIPKGSIATLTIFSVGALVWIGSGTMAWVTSGFGCLDPREPFVWSPMLALPVWLLAGPLLGRERLWRCLVAFLLTLAGACVFSLVTMIFDVRPGEALVRGTSGAVTQALIPGSAKTAAGGFYYHRLRLAHVLLVGLGGWLHAMLVRRRSARWAFAAPLFGITLLFTYARAAWAGALVGLAVTACFLSRRARFLVFGVALTTVLGALCIPSVRDRIGQGVSGERRAIWRIASAIIADHPWGVGWGNYPGVAGEALQSLDPETRRLVSTHTNEYAHNVVLVALAESGPLGMLGYLATFFGLGVWAAFRLRREQDGLLRAALLGVVFVTSAFFFVGMWHDVFTQKVVSFAAHSVVGLLAALANSEEGRLASDPKRP